MEARKVEFVPDYKSDRERWDAGCAKYGMAAFGSAFNTAVSQGARVDEALRTAEYHLERARLEREVIEAAKEWHHVGNSTALEPYKLDTRNRLGHAVDALESLEAEQVNGK